MRLYVLAVFAMLVAALAPVTVLHAQTLTVMSSGGFAAPYKALAPGYEAAQHTHLTLVFGSSAAAVPGSIPSRLAASEPADVVILARTDLDALVAKGFVVAGSEVDLAASRIAMAVRAGAPIPNIGTVAAFRQTLLNAASVAYSGSASGIYIKNELYKRLGIERELAAKSRAIVETPVGEAVAHGNVEIGFQQMSELKPVAGITIVGAIPEEVQKITTFSAGVVTASTHQLQATNFIRYLAATSACNIIADSAMQPIACAPPK